MLSLLCLLLILVSYSFIVGQLFQSHVLEVNYPIEKKEKV